MRDKQNKDYFEFERPIKKSSVYVYEDFYLITTTF